MTLQEWVHIQNSMEFPVMARLVNLTYKLLELSERKEKLQKCPHEMQL